MVSSALIQFSYGHMTLYICRWAYGSSSSGSEQCDLVPLQVSGKDSDDVITSGRKGSWKGHNLGSKASPDVIPRLFDGE